MSSLNLDKSGGKRIQFTAPNGKRVTIYLGKRLPLRQAQTVKGYIERLLIAAESGDNIDSDTAAWLRKITDALHTKLAAVGLVPKRELVTLGAFIADYIDKRQDVKPASKTVWKQGERSLIEYFGADRLVQQITRTQTEDYKQALIGQGLALYTVRKRLQAAKMFFNAMVRRGVIQENPFNDVQVAAVVDESRNVYVSKADIESVLDACPDTEWRVIVTLSRFGGLRCPSEVLSLKWEHIDWNRQRITVISPKTEHYPNGGQRVIPLFPELVGPLQEAFDMAKDGAIYVISKHRSQADSKAGWRNSNLRTSFEKIIRRAGLRPWPKPFHGLRASSETDLLERFPIQTVAKWLGHSPKIALAHYARTVDDHFRAAVTPQQVTQNPTSAAHVIHSNRSLEAVKGDSYQVEKNAAKTNPNKDLRKDTKEYNLASCFSKTDGEGFEPPVDSRPQQFSRLPP